ncbi:unnamed protein product, partial [Rotaria magnacalcarata]
LSFFLLALLVLYCSSQNFC